MDRATLALEAVAAALQAVGAGQKHDSPGSPSATIFSHGPQGNLVFPGVDPTVINAKLGAESLLLQLPSTPAVDTNPTYMTMTGTTGDSGSEKDGVCDNAPTAGLIKTCVATSVFGRYERATPEIDLTRLGQVVNRADPMDLTLRGSPMFGSGGPYNGGAMGTTPPRDLFTNETSRKLWELALSFHALLTRQLWTANPANNSAGGGYREMTGLQSLVNTGYRDAETGALCPASDPQVINFGSARVDASGTQIVAALTNMFYQARDIAIRTGLMPVRWALAMKPQLFYELTQLWPCAYNTFRCVTLNDQASLNIDGKRMTEMRDAMRQGRYLLLDGIQIEVILDDGIAETSTVAGCFDTDIYLLPMSVQGGFATLFLEHFDYNNPSLRAALGEGLVLGRVNGPFLTWPRQTNTCFVFQSVIQPRLVLRTPQLAGRLQNVRYCPIQHTRDAFNDGGYFVDGGATQRGVSPGGTSLYSIWQS